MLTKILSFLSLKRIFGLFFLILLTWWFFSGPEVISKFKGKEKQDEVCDIFIQKNPQLADFIATQKNRFGILSTAAAIESSKVHSLNSEVRRRSIEVRARLSSLFEKDYEKESPFLWSHGTAIDAMEGLPEETDNYLSKLEAAKQDPDYWSLVRDDPIALTSDLLEIDRNLRREYRKNRDWYQEMLEVLIEMIEIAEDEIEEDEKNKAGAFIRLDDLLRVVSDGKPYLMELVPNPRKTPIEACIYFEAFREFGKAIKLVAAEGVSPKEAVEVIILNRDAFYDYQEGSDVYSVEAPEIVALRLIQINRERPSVWKAAQLDGFVLAFDKLTPSLSQSVLEKHPDLGVASLIVTQYEDLASQAAKIVDEYGELGMAVLVQYEGSAIFQNLLRRADADHRIAMVAVLKSDVGLESVFTNPANIDKWIGENGKPLEPQWWENVPGGALTKVIQNYSRGISSDWSEIGWAAWDVADFGLLVVSFGTASAATATAKQAAKQATRQAARQTAKNAVKKLAEAGIRRAGTAARQSAMARLITILTKSGATTVIKWSAKIVIYLSRGATTLLGKLVTACRNITNTVKSIPPGVRQWAARGLLGASLFVRGPERIRALVASINQYAVNLATDSIRSIPAGIEKAYEELKKSVSGNLAFLSNAIYFLVLLVFGYLAVLCLHEGTPQLAFPNFGSGRKAGGRPSSSNSRKKK
jgi:hypothetical protein